MGTVITIVYWYNLASSVWSWLTSPSIAPWLGLAAAIASAMAIDSRGWFNSFGRTFFRILRIVVIWLAITLSFYAICGGGEAGGAGGRGREINRKADGENPAIPEIPEIINQCDLLIWFPKDSNPTQSINFGCNISKKNTDNTMKTIEIRGHDHIDFKNKLTKSLDQIKLKSSPKIIVLENPYPGEYALQTVESLLGSSFTNSSLTRQQYREPSNGQDK